MSLMGSFYTGVSGLNASQNALNTVAHNLANVDTKGHTRQMVEQGNRIYLDVGEAGTSTMQVGLGVDITKVRSARDYFLDLAYRESAGRESYYTTQREAVSEINTVFGEMIGNPFRDALSAFQQSIESLQGQPEDATRQAQVVTNANIFIERAQAVYNGLAKYQDNLNEQIKDQVNSINKIAEEIYELNGKIALIEAGGIETANDMRDARNYLIDQLASYGNITFYEDSFHYVNIQFEGTDLVKRGILNKMGVIETEPEAGFYTPVWTTLGDQNVFNLSEPVSSLHLTDKGSLRSLIDARGDKRGCYADMFEYTDTLSGEDYTDDGTVSGDKSTASFERVAGSSVASSMAMFDYLIYSIADGVNSILMRNSDGSDDYQPLFDTMSQGAVNVHGQDTELSVNHLRVNPKLLEEPASMNNGFILKLDESSKDQETADMLRDFFQTTGETLKVTSSKTITTGLTLTPDTISLLKVSEYYTGIVQSYADIGNLYKNMEDSLEAQLNTNEDERQSVIGVSDSDELTHMIRYQNAYNASSRYFNVVNEMLENLLSQLA